MKFARFIEGSHSHDNPMVYIKQPILKICTELNVNEICILNERIIQCEIVELW